MWPDWDHQVHPRQCRFGKPADTKPVSAPHDLTVKEPTIWAGPVVEHFGHQLADFSTRMVQSIQQWPDLPLLFALSPRLRAQTAQTTDDLPDFFLEILRWYGISPEKIRLLKSPTLYQQLMVVPQGEQLGGPGPKDGYLDRLDGISESKLQNGIFTNKVKGLYVSRAAQLGKFAGEKYLEKIFLYLGFSVLRPETVPVERQLAAYLGADKLIFAEGSALHGLQLLGHLNKPVDVVLRRPKSRLAQYSIRPRTSSLRYHDLVSDLIHGTKPNGMPALEMGITILDEGRLVGCLESIGVRASTIWRSRDFAKCVANDVNEWVDRELRSPRSMDSKVIERIKETLRWCGRV